MSTQAGFAVLLAGVGAMRLAELAISRRRWSERPAALVDEGPLFPLMALLHAGLVVLPITEVVTVPRPWDAHIAVVAGGVLLAATGLRIWTLRTLGAAFNVRVVAPKTVVTTGPYAHIRHPNYAVVILEIAALPMLHGAWCSALVLGVANLAVLRVRIRTEERTLAQDPAWAAWFADKPRFVPGLW